MSTGKQLSFAYGEIAPTLQFKSNAVAYSQGAGKLRNFFVRRTGGFSNRPGFIHVMAHPYQGRVEQGASGHGPHITGFFTQTLTGNNGAILLEIRYKDSASKYLAYNNFIEDTYEIDTQENFLEKLDFVEIDNGVAVAGRYQSTFIGPPSVVSKTNLFFNKTPQTWSVVGKPTFIFGPTSWVGFGNGTGPYYPVTYALRGVDQRGTEFDLGKYTTPPMSLPGGIAFPNPGLWNFIEWTFATDPGYRTYRIYRAVGEGGGMLTLAGVLPGTLNALKLRFEDFGGGDASQVLPDDNTLYGPQAPIGFAVSDARAIAVYQQRLIFDCNITGSPKGTMSASRVGAQIDLEAPRIYTNVGPFQFNVPVTDGGDVVASLAMERLVLFTANGAYVIRGAEDGALTPTTVNPFKISSDGCSETVRPRSNDRRGYYLNNDHTKLMAIEFADNGAVAVGEIGAFAEHLITANIHRMEVITGVEDLIFLLDRAGTIIVASVNFESGSVGFSTFETNGFVENIMPIKKPVYYAPRANPNPISPLAEGQFISPDTQSLAAYIIRDGVRYLEIMADRSDDEGQAEVYVDAAICFGYRLTDIGTQIARFRNSRFTPNSLLLTLQTNTFMGDTPCAQTLLNIIGGTTWEAGETLIVESDTDLDVMIDPAGPRIDFYFGDTKIRFVPQATATPVNFAYAYEGYFLQDVPPALRDVENQTGVNKVRLQSQWNFASNRLYGLTHLANKQVALSAEGIVLSSPNNAEFPTLTVDGAGELELPDYYAWGVVGLPYECEFESLDLEVQGERTLTDKPKLITALGVALYNTRHGQAGTKEETDFLPVLFRDDPDVDNITKNFSGFKEISVAGSWERTGRVRILQNDPAPMTVLSIYPKGLSGD